MNLDWDKNLAFLKKNGGKLKIIVDDWNIPPPKDSVELFLLKNQTNGLSLSTPSMEIAF